MIVCELWDNTLTDMWNSGFGGSGGRGWLESTYWSFYSPIKTTAISDSTLYLKLTELRKSHSEEGCVCDQCPFTEWKTVLLQCMRLEQWFPMLSVHGVPWGVLKRDWCPVVPPGMSILLVRGSGASQPGWEPLGQSTEVTAWAVLSAGCTRCHPARGRALADAGWAGRAGAPSAPSPPLRTYSQQMICWSGFGYQRGLTAPSHSSFTP